MVVDVEDRHPLGTAVDQVLGGDRGVVEKAVAAVEVGRGVVARRAAQGEHGRVRRRRPAAWPPVSATSALLCAARQVPAVIGVPASKL